MALTIGNGSFLLVNPGSTIVRSYTHTQNTGSSRALVVVTASPTTGISGVKYAGVSLTNRSQIFDSLYSTHWGIWELLNPLEGAQTLEVTWLGETWNPCLIFTKSFVNSTGIRQFARNMIASTSALVNLPDVAAGSAIIGSSINGGGTGLSMQIPDGTTIALEYNHNINNFTFGGTSGILTAGTHGVRALGLASGIVQGVEVGVVTVVPRRRIFLIT